MLKDLSSLRKKSYEYMYIHTVIQYRISISRIKLVAPCLACTFLSPSRIFHGGRLDEAHLLPHALSQLTGSQVCFMKNGHGDGQNVSAD